MAQKTVITMVDDTSGMEIPDGAGETVTFGLDGNRYEIDLNDANAEALRADFSGWISFARLVDAPGKKAKQHTPEQQASPKLIRAWAKANGFDIPKRGTLSRKIRAAYYEAHADKPAKPRSSRSRSIG